MRWGIGTESTLEMGRAQILAKAGEFAAAVDCDWPWSDGVWSFIEEADSRAALWWNPKDEDQLLEVEEQFQEETWQRAQGFSCRSRPSRVLQKLYAAP